MLEEKLQAATNDNKLSESQSLILVRKIEDMRKHITELNNKINHQNQNEEKVKFSFIEKDQEIRFLKNFISNLKSDNKGK